MNRVIVVDTVLLVLLVVGRAGPALIAKHKRLQHYTVGDYQWLEGMVADARELILVPHVLAEVSNLARQIRPPDRTAISRALEQLIATYPELPLQSALGVAREEFIQVGLADSILLCLTSMEILGIGPTLITSDTLLANRAASLGLDVIDYLADVRDQ